MLSLLALPIGFLLDLCLGDPYWMPHPVRLMGKVIGLSERLLRRVFPKTPTGELIAGGVMAICVPALFWGVSFTILWAAGLVHPLLRLVLESWCIYQLLAAKSLRTESMKVQKALLAGDVEGARKAVSMIVGRDTKCLDKTGIARAAVETVAENASDGEIAPLIFMALGGAPLGFLYKAVNTMDSMVGYKNETYLYYGRVAARLDDVLNFLPARLAGLLMVVCAPLCGLDGKGAWRIFLRDRKKHASPNSAQTESACAGALGLLLAGDAWYFGKLHQKESIGDPVREIEARDIAKSNRLMYAASIVCLGLCTLLRALFLSLFL